MIAEVLGGMFCMLLGLLVLCVATASGFCFINLIGALLGVVLIIIGLALLMPPL